ncbi:hypothetical protein DFA_02898 [Cavenderia fasciculata]|uniref:IPT/TIG domain-containing protein n=1 Tax=Cavenderia fasciculata TaxID=261658 RepID=F4PIS5_CACFS|nr:uncharacterized protein DFA_02898 [Cavenderia fasciculata]EGG24654.1 hypothetical protein DFA_02898 [Cavenderia fasciculata]|eukprot:XP_004362505.1 hypothetical protein DFA_02898 [Cavenderia fasciculata]
MTPSNNILYDIYGGTISSKIEDVRYYKPLIAFNITDAPMIDNITSIIPGQASQVTINGNHFGKDSSYVLISIQGSQCKSPMFIENNYQQISCSLGSVEPYSTDLNYTVKIGSWWNAYNQSCDVPYTIEFGKLKVRSEVSRGDQIIWTRVQVGRTVLNCKIASRMVIDDSTIIPSKVTLLTNDDPVSQQIWKSGGFNILTTFHIPRFSQSVELDPVFNALILGDNSHLPYECTEETTDQWTFIIVAVVLSAALLSIIIVVLVIVFIKRPPTNRPPNREPPIEMDIITSTEDINTHQQQQNNNEY